jgi:mannose-1-phosphate guanylyltransferase
MKAILLVGGFGTRLRPLTLGRPKQMLPVVGRTMFERVIERLGECGVDEAVLSLGFQPDKFVAAFPTNECAGVKLHYAIEPEPLDTAGAIRFAAVHAGLDETFLVLNGDVMCDVDYRRLVDAHRAFGSDATIHLTPVDDPSRFGVVPTDAEGRVIRFVEKPPAGTAPSNDINAGTYVLELSVLELIAEDRPVSIERETFPALAEQGRLFGFPTDDYWLDAGTPMAYVQANLDLVNGVRAAEVAIDSSAVIDAGATVTNSVVMAGAHVAEGAVVENSVVMAGASIGRCRGCRGGRWFGDSGVLNGRFRRSGAGRYRADWVHSP